MATDLQTNEPASMAGTVRGILEDVQGLLEHQIDLIRAEIKADWDKTKTAGLALLIGLGPVMVGGALCILMLVHLLHWLTSPPQQDLATIPLWGCYGIVGGVCLAVGAGLMYFGVQRFKRFNPLPDESVQSFKENLQWLTKRKPTSE